MNAELKGQKAAAILEQEVFQEAVEGARKRIKNEWEAATTQTERESLWNQLKALDRVPRELRAIRDHGVKHKHDQGRTQ